MRIGILGSGLMGGKLGTLFAKAGHDVVFSYARSQRKLNRLAREAGSRAAAGTPREPPKALRCCSWPFTGRASMTS
jgi:8-hydroxy-5-deazaflavin:NADPH oxidoreductase